MPTTFTWFDYSEHERRKTVDVIELFREQLVRKKLGLIAFLEEFWICGFRGQLRAEYPTHRHKPLKPEFDS
jgi:hypothetical protein